MTTVNKTACRMPEALWYSFNPIVSEHGAKWFVDKVNYPTPSTILLLVSQLASISLFTNGVKMTVDNVVVNGTRHLHATWNGVSYQTKNSHFTLFSLDAGLVGFGSMLHFSFAFPSSQFPLFFVLIILHDWGLRLISLSTPILRTTRCTESLPYAPESVWGPYTRHSLQSL